MMVLGEGPSVTKYLLCAYYLLQSEFSYWARRENKRAGWERIRIYQDWQSLEGQPDVGEINVIYLKYDWRLEMPQVDRDYIDPLIKYLDRRWPGSKLHWIGHSLGGLVGRYAVCSHPGRFTSVFSVGGPQLGIYEIGAQLKGEMPDYGEQWDLGVMQRFSILIAERFFLHLQSMKSGPDFNAQAAEFARNFTPMMRWMAPNSDLLTDGFGSLPKLKDAVPHAIAFYSLGFPTFDLWGKHNPEIPAGRGVGRGIEPNEDSPPEYAITGDGRVDPISARGPFTQTLCVGKDMLHTNLMWSPLVLTTLIDRLYFDGKMSYSDLRLALARLQVTGAETKKDLKWFEKARKVWETGN